MNFVSASQNTILHRSESDKYIDIATWGHFRSSHARLSAAQSRHNPTWEYLFEWSSPVDPEKGSCHAIELPFVFCNKENEIYGEDPPMTSNRTGSGCVDQFCSQW